MPVLKESFLAGLAVSAPVLTTHAGLTGSVVEARSDRQVLVSKIHEYEKRGRGKLFPGAGINSVGLAVARAARMRYI